MSTRRRLPYDFIRIIPPQYTVFMKSRIFRLGFKKITIEYFLVGTGILQRSSKNESPIFPINKCISCTHIHIHIL